MQSDNYMYFHGLKSKKIKYLLMEKTRIVYNTIQHRILSEVSSWQTKLQRYCKVAEMFHNVSCLLGQNIS